MKLMTQIRLSSAIFAAALAGACTVPPEPYNICELEEFPPELVAQIKSRADYDRLLAMMFDTCPDQALLLSDAPTGSVARVTLRDGGGGSDIENRGNGPVPAGPVVPPAVTPPPAAPPATPPVVTPPAPPPAGPPPGVPPVVVPPVVPPVVTPPAGPPGNGPNGANCGINGTTDPSEKAKGNTCA